MTNQELRALEAEVAAKVMGWLVVVPDNGEEWYERQVTRYPCLIQHREGGQWLTRHHVIGDPGFDEFWSPATNRTATQTVIDHLWATGEFAEIEVRRYFAHKSGEACVMCEIKRKDWSHHSGFFCHIERLSDGGEMVAICRAALKAMESSPC